MPMSTKLIPAVIAIVMCCGQTVHAQFATTSSLPNEGELNRIGLTMAWWAQASINPRKDKIEYFTADEQCVYLQSSAGIVTCLHGEQGRKLWYRLVGIPDQQSFPVTTNEKEVLVTIGVNLYSLKKDTGQTLWQLTCDEPPSTSPDMDDNFIYVGTIDGSVWGYNLLEVQKLYPRGMLPQWTIRTRMWNFQTPDLIISPPIPHGDNVVFASRRGIVYSLVGANKQLRWQLEAGNEIHTPLGHSGDRIFVADRNARMLCVNIESGSVLWTFAGGSPINQQPRVVGNDVYVVPHREGLTSVAINSGGVSWQQPQATAFVTATDAHVYARDHGGNLLVLDRESGQILSSVNLRNFPLQVSNDRTDRIYLASTTGTVIALREIGSEYPAYHLYPERRPILPEFASEEAAEE